MRGVKAIIEPIKAAAINGVLSGVNAVLTAWNSLSFTIPSVTVPFVGTFGGQTIGTPNVGLLPLLAAGGQIQRAGSAIVGERGPELVELPRGAQVSPLNGDGNGDGDGDRMTINFYGPIYSVDDFDEAVNRARLRFRSGRGTRWRA